jgi:hypothetical protein
MKNEKLKSLIVTTSFCLLMVIPLAGLAQSDNDYFTDRTYQEEPFTNQPRSIPADQWNKFKTDDDFWYANAKIRRDKTSQQTIDEKPSGTTKGNKTQTQTQTQRTTYVPIQSQSWFQTFIWIILFVSFAVIIVLFLAKNNVGFFRKKQVKIDEGKGEEDIPENIFEINYQREIDKAASAGNFRLAIRLMFLRLLKNMDERHIISYKQDKTNFDYLMETQSTNYYNNFFRITRNYEYSWYGKFPVSEEGYRVIRNDFDRFDQQFGIH